MTPTESPPFPHTDQAKPLIAAALQLYGTEACLRAIAQLIRDMAPDTEWEHKLGQLARARILGAITEAEETF